MIGTDRLRKQLASVREEQRLAPEPWHGIYAPEHTDPVALSKFVQVLETVHGLVPVAWLTQVHRLAVGAGPTGKGDATRPTQGCSGVADPR